MPLAFYFNPPSKMSAQQYDEAVARLKAAGAGNPPGRLYHSCFGPPDSLMVFDVWTSQEEFNKFGETLMPIMQALGIDSGQPDVMTVHNTIVPPARKATSAKKAKASKKKAKLVKKSAKKKNKKR